MKKKEFTFPIFYKLLIDPYSKDSHRENLSKMFYGQKDRISYATASKMRSGEYKFALSRGVTPDYFTFSEEERTQFMRSLDLFELPGSGKDICQMLEDYDLSSEIYSRIYHENDKYVVLVHLLYYLLKHPGAVSVQKTIKNSQGSTDVKESNQENILHRIYEPSFYKKIGDAVFENLIEIEEDGAVHYGWERFLTKKLRIGEWSTAFGLYIAVFTDCKNLQYIKHRNDIINTLWDRKKEFEHGFKSDNQMFPSLDATSVVAKAFYLEREYDKAYQTFQDLIYLWNHQDESHYEGEIPIMNLCYVLNSMVLFDYDGPERKDVEQQIWDRAVPSESDQYIYWTDNDSDYPSIANSAMVISSLIASAEQRGEDTEAIEKLKGCGEWIYDSDWTDSLDATRRSAIVDGMNMKDSRLFDHYAPTKCITALLQLGYSKQDPRILAEMAAMLSLQDHGLWYYPLNTRQYQMWMVEEILECILFYKNV